MDDSWKHIYINRSWLYNFSHVANSKMFNITSKYFTILNNKPTASWVAHITRDFLACYSCSYYSSMIYPNFQTLILILSCNKFLSIFGFLIKLPAFGIVVLDVLDFSSFMFKLTTNINLVMPFSFSNIQIFVLVMILLLS